MSDFYIGGVAIYVRPGSPHYGREVTVLSSLTWWPPSRYDHLNEKAMKGGHAYEITALEEIPGPWIAKPSWLKKKGSPRRCRECDRIVSWDDCLWAPDEVGCTHE